MRAKPKKKTKVVLVEDDQVIASIYVDKLSRSGFNVLLAGDGVLGEEMILQEHPDIVLLDLIIPKKTGQEVLESIKNNAATKNIPVVVLTNDYNTDHIKDCINLGAKKTIFKADHTPHEVVRMIEDVVEQSSKNSLREK